MVHGNERRTHYTTERDGDEMKEYPGGIGPIIVNKVILAVLTAILTLCTLIVCLFHPKRYVMRHPDDI